MSSVKPSRKIFFLLVACVVGVSAIGFAVYASKAKDVGAKNNATAVNGSDHASQLVAGILKESSEKDDDKDGLLNWEEVLWNTDPKNPDTDKDSTKDGDEVKTNRNPTKAGPDDKLTDLTDELKTKAVVQVESDTTRTGKISRELFSNYLEAKRTGATLDSQVQNKIISETFTGQNLVLPYKKYTAGDVKLTNSFDLKTYGNNLGLAFYSGKAQSNVGEIQILSDAVVGGKKEDISKLDPIINAYSAMLTSLETVQTPKEMLSKHVALLNSTSKLLADIKAFREIFADPLTGVAGVSNYYPDVEAFQQSIIAIENEFAKNNIAYTNEEFGSVFTNTIQ